MKKFWLFLMVAALATGLTFVSCAIDGDGAPTPTPGGDSWTVDFTGLSLTGEGEYVGQTGIQRGATAAELVFTIVADKLNIANTGQFKQVNIQVGTAAGGTAYYHSDGFTAVPGTEYTLTFMASVAAGTGQLRFLGNSKIEGGEFGNAAALTTTPTLVTYTWTQASGTTGGNLKFDTGSTADGTISISDLKIEW